MIINFKINFDRIEGFVNLDRAFKDEIKEKILSDLPVYKFAKKVEITSVSIGYFLNKDNSFISIKHLVEILKILNIKLRTADRYIIDFKDSNSKKNYDIKFPYYFTPVDMRIVGVLVGDGNVGKKNKLLRWIQKDINPLKELLYSKISYEVSNNYNKQLVVQQIVIPSFFGKFASSLFNLSLFELGTYKLVKRSLNLPKYYRIALLIAIIEDEGNIDPKNYSGINIRMSDRDVISNLKKLCDSLGYKTSKIIKYKNNLGSHKRNEMYKLNILSDGIFKLGYDILEFENIDSDFSNEDIESRFPDFSDWQRPDGPPRVGLQVGHWKTQEICRVA